MNLKDILAKDSGADPDVLQALAEVDDLSTDERLVDLKSKGVNVDRDSIIADDEQDQPREDVPWATAEGMTRHARAFLRDHPDARINVIFPEIYSEDSTQQMADLALARQEGAISHERMSIEMAKELELDGYDYQTEREQIAEEPSITSGPLGTGDAAIPDQHRQDLADLRGDERAIARHEEADRQVIVKTVIRDPVTGRISQVQEAPIGVREAVADAHKLGKKDQLIADLQAQIDHANKGIRELKEALANRQVYIDELEKIPVTADGQLITLREAIHRTAQERRA